MFIIFSKDHSGLDPYHTFIIVTFKMNELTSKS